MTETESPGVETLGEIPQLHVGVCMMLLVQFLLGMTANLYVTIPDHHPGAGDSNYLGGVVRGISWVLPHGAVALAFHALVGLALIGFSIRICVAVYRRKPGRTLAITTTVAALCILGAAFNGASFLNYDNDVNSMIMATLFAVAFGCYIIGLAWMMPRESATR